MNYQALKTNSKGHLSTISDITDVLHDDIFLLVNKLEKYVYKHRTNVNDGLKSEEVTSSIDCRNGVPYCITVSIPEGSKRVETIFELIVTDPNVYEWPNSYL